jgi:general stress protein YciG
MNDNYEDNNSNDRNNRSGGQGRGFASMDPDKQRKIASKGGKAAHRKGTAHEFTPDEAKKAGQKGGRARSRRSAL